MATNSYFNNYEYSGEQDLIESLIIESIRMYGIDVQYCPRTIVNRNETFNEDAVSSYDSAYTIEMYVKNIEGFEGEGDFLSKFNIQIRDEITFTVAQKIFGQIVGTPETMTRPQEGDIIYFPLTKKIYVVKFVEHEPTFYQTGKLQTYDLRCELFEYSNESLNTGVAEIDAIEEDYSTNVGVDPLSLDANGHVIIDANTGRPTTIANNYFDNDMFADNDNFESRANGIIDWSERNPFQENDTY